MVCSIRMVEKPVLNDPVLIEGLPGIGFVANLSTLHLIQKLKARMFAEIHSSYFQDLAIIDEEGKTRFPINGLYYHKGRGEERDLIILYGNTQALTTVGQYELCGCILNIAEEIGCRYILTLGGLKRKEKAESPKLYCAATDTEALRDAQRLGARILGGQIFGIAGLLVGLGKLRGMKGFCLLAETTGFYPDPIAARSVSKAICEMLRLKVDFDRLDTAVVATNATLKSFGLVFSPPIERVEDSGFRWFI